MRAVKSAHFFVHLSPLQTFLWLTCASLLGVVLSAPMRRHFIVDQKLAFPDGMAAAETLLVLDPPRDAPAARRNGARNTAMVMGLCLLASGALMLVRSELQPAEPDPRRLGHWRAETGRGRRRVHPRGPHGRRRRPPSLLSLGSGMIVACASTPG